MAFSASGRTQITQTTTPFSYRSKKQMSHGLTANVNYTYSHSIDDGSSWHDSATSAAGGAGGDGYSTDNNNLGLDRGNSVFDIRHRLVFNYVYQLPGQNLHGAEGLLIGGWSLNGIWAFQSGPHWSPYTRLTGADLTRRLQLKVEVQQRCLRQCRRRVDIGWSVSWRRSSGQQRSALHPEPHPRGRMAGRNFNFFKRRHGR